MCEELGFRFEAPSPHDRSLNRRGWRLSMKAWRTALHVHSKIQIHLMTPTASEKEVDVVADELQWVRRHRKRHAAITHVFTTEEFKVCESLGFRPDIPDWQDRTVSMRRWEATVQVWRNSLRAFSQASQNLGPTAPA